MKKLFSYILLLSCFSAFAQTPGSVAPCVINSTAGSGSNGTLNVIYSVGEPVVNTGSNGTDFYTQGFLQPDYSGSIGVLTVQGFATNISCAGANDGSITLNVTGGHGNIGYVWQNTPADTSRQTNLLAGSYSVIIYDSLPNGTAVAYNGGTPIQFTINDATGPCAITVFHAFSPNGDGKNDDYIITGIENFPDNTVSFFNRWGVLVWETEKYNNQSNSWNGKDKNGNELSEGTYFYIIDLKDGKPKKGWVELTK